MAKERVVVVDPETDELRVGALDPNKNTIKLSDNREYNADEISFDVPLDAKEVLEEK